MKQLLTYIKPYRKYYIFLGVILAATAILTALGPYFFKLVIDNGIMAKRYDVLVGLIAIMFFIEMGTMAFNWLQTYLFTKVGQHVVSDIKSDAYKHLTLKSPEFYAKHTVGDLISRVDGDSTYLEMALTRNLVNLISDTIMVIAMIGFLIYLNYQLFLLAAVVLPAAFFAQKIIGKQVDNMFQSLRNTVGGTSKFLFETVSHMSSFKSHGREAYLQKEYRTKATEVAAGNTGLGKIFANSTSSIQLLSSLASGIISLAGGYLVIKGRLSLGGLVSFTTYFFKVFGPVQNFARINLDLTTTKVSLNRLNEIMGENIAASGDGQKPDLSMGDINFRNVVFSYIKKRPVLNNTSWNLPAKKTMLLQGASGAGKTTTANLLLRHFNIDQGSITIGGTNIEEIDASYLRSNVFIVEQDPLIISGSLKENLAIFTDNKPTECEMKEALNKACLDDLLAAWPNGLETEIGENGINLSGGQKQRIALARAILANPPIMIMDEATSAIDLDTELEILARMRSFLSKRTVIIITHRPAELIRPDMTVALKEKTLKTLSITQNGAKPTVSSGSEL